MRSWWAKVCVDADEANKVQKAIHGMSVEQSDYIEAHKINHIKIPFDNENIKFTRDKPHIEDSVDFDHRELKNKRLKEKEFFYTQFD